MLWKVELTSIGYLTQCPTCEPMPSTSLVLAFNQIGDDIVIRCYGGCKDEQLREGFSILADDFSLLTHNEWLLRESSRGHKIAYLQEKLRDNLATPLTAPLSDKIEPRDFSELMSIKLPKREEICGPWLKQGTITELYGWRGAGKSWLALWLAYCVATGRDFLRWSLIKAHKVLYVDGEMGFDDIQDRLARIHRSESARAGKALQPQLKYFSDSDDERFPDGLPNLSTDAGKRLIEDSLSGVSLLILDNLSTLYNSSIENDAESWVDAQDWLKGIRRKGVSVMFLHHAGKGGQQRGTSKREDLCNNVICLKQPDNYKAAQGAQFKLVFEKSRGVHGSTVDELSVQLTEENHNLVWVMEEHPSDNDIYDRVLDLHDEGRSIREIASVLGLPKSSVHRAIEKAKGKRQG